MWRSADILTEQIAKNMICIAWKHPLPLISLMNSQLLQSWMHTSLHLTLFFFFLLILGEVGLQKVCMLFFRHLISVCSTLYFKNAKCSPTVDWAVASNHIDTNCKCCFTLVPASTVNPSLCNVSSTLCSYKPHLYPTCLWICSWVWDSLFIYLLLEQKPTYVYHSVWVQFVYAKRLVLEHLFVLSFPLWVFYFSFHALCWLFCYNSCI